jgi:hypothetical protein
MKYWRFLDYVSGDTNPIHDWLHQQGPDVWARVNALIRNLEIRPQLERPDVGLLRKPPCKGEGLIELILKINRVQYRPIGWYGPHKGAITLLAGAIEKGGKFEPRNVEHTAIRRKQAIIADRRHVKDHDFS